MKDLYLILQAPLTATPEQIRSAYRRRALELHPDRSGAGSEAFIELQRAYSILSDPIQRAAYDRQAHSFPSKRRGLRSRPAVEPFRQVEPPDDLREIWLVRSLEKSASSYGESLWDTLDFLTPPRAQAPEFLTLEAALSKEEARTGGRLRVLVPARMPCHRCRGRGATGLYECWRCQGSGLITVEYPVDVAYPAGLRREHVVHMRLDDFGIPNLYLTVRFRIAPCG